MKKRFFTVICICMILFSYIPVHAMVPQNSQERHKLEVTPRTVYSEYVTLGAQNGAAVEVQILKNDVGNRIYIMGVNMVTANGDIGIPRDSIYITHVIHDNGAFVNITIHYTHWGTAKTRTHTIYAY